MSPQVYKNKMIIMHGKGVSQGLAKGRAFVYRDVLNRDSKLYFIEHEQIDDEKLRINKAITDVREGLVIDAKHIEKKLNKNAAEIFQAQEAILSDSTILVELLRTLEEDLVNAEQTVRTVFRMYARRFREMENSVFKDKGDDIDDLSRRLLLSLSGIHAHCLENLPPQTILVARRLLPSDTVYLSRDSTVGVIAEFAGMAAHAALIARELGIPCVGDITNLFGIIDTGDTIIIDGTSGKVVANPDTSSLKDYDKSLKIALKVQSEALRISRTEKTVTLDGVEVSIMANARSREDVFLAIERGADGIGLFRTEPFFLASKHLPTDVEFADFLRVSLKPAQGKHINVRLLDIGADKNPIYLHLPLESDPFLGRRGIRILRAYPELLEAQIRAMLEVSKELALSILIPMVVTEDDVIMVVKKVRELAVELGISVLPQIGAMIETPAAALSVLSLKKYVDFFSIGSNDLIQYMMAAGRENPLVSEYYIDDHPSIFRLIKLIVKDAGDTPVSICGEIAGRSELIAKILDTGIRSLSVSAALVPYIKNTVLKTNISEFVYN